MNYNINSSGLYDVNAYNLIATNATVLSQASFNTMRYKGRDSASGIDRKLSIIRPGATTIVAP